MDLAIIPPSSLHLVLKVLQTLTFLISVAAIMDLLNLRINR